MEALLPFFSRSGVLIRIVVAGLNVLHFTELTQARNLQIGRLIFHGVFFVSPFQDR
jgi:hypothetical protein